MKAIIEILKDIGSMLFAVLFGLIGLAIAKFVARMSLWEADGVGWQAIIVGIVFVVIGYFIYKFGKNLFEK